MNFKRNIWSKVYNPMNHSRELLHLSNTSCLLHKVCLSTIRPSVWFIRLQECSSLTSRVYIFCFCSEWWYQSFLETCSPLRAVDIFTQGSIFQFLSLGDFRMYNKPYILKTVQFNVACLATFFYGFWIALLLLGIHKSCKLFILKWESVPGVGVWCMWISINIINIYTNNELQFKRNGLLLLKWEDFG